MRNPVRLLITTGALVGALVLTGGPAQATAVVTISQGHVDVIGVAYEDDALHVHVHDETVEPDVEREPEDVKFQVLGTAKTTVPDDPAYGFLGTPGAPVWVLPQTQNPDLLWPGIGAEELEPGVFKDDTVKICFRAIRGPGDVALYTEDAFGQPANVLVDSGDGLPDSISLRAGDHLHANWAFEKAGHYRLLVSATGTLAANNQTVTSGLSVYHFQVLNPTP